MNEYNKQIITGNIIVTILLLISSFISLLNYFPQLLVILIRKKTIVDI